MAPTALSTAILLAAAHAERLPGHVGVVVALEQLQLARAADLLHEIVELVFVGEVVDQAVAQRVFGQERPLVDRRPRPRLSLLRRPSAIARTS